MITKKEYYKWKMVKLIKGKEYKHISFVTAYYFFGIPVYKYEKYKPNKLDEFDLDTDGGFVEEIPQKKTKTYIPSKDEIRIMSGEIETSFE